MKIRQIALIAACIIVGGSSMSAQTTREEIYAHPELAGGVYYAYPVTNPEVTPAPDGYKPFYISHYGRHGSRYLISDGDYINALRPLQLADSLDLLTEFGADVLSRVEQAWGEAEGRGGELTPLGRRQHHDIAQRMYRAYPEAFEGNPTVTAASTTVMRCAHSMFAFMEGLKELNPSLQIDRESSNRHMNYLNYHSPESGPYASSEGEWHKDYVAYKERVTQPDRMMSALFVDPERMAGLTDPGDLMWALYWLAVDMQNAETQVTFWDVFTPEELFGMWELHNFSFYATNSSYPKADGQHVDNAKNLLRNVVETADSYIAEGRNGATLRFGHDGNVVPYTALLQFPGCVAYEADPDELYKVYTNFKVSPMASNIQIVFFKNDSGDVLVKFLHNEKEVSIPCATDNFPFYKWTEARPALQKILDTPCREYIPKQ